METDANVTPVKPTWRDKLAATMERIESDPDEELSAAEIDPVWHAVVDTADEHYDDNFSYEFFPPQREQEPNTLSATKLPEAFHPAVYAGVFMLNSISVWQVSRFRPRVREVLQKAGELQAALMLLTDREREWVNEEVEDQLHCWAAFDDAPAMRRKALARTYKEAIAMYGPKRKRTDCRGAAPVSSKPIRLSFD